MAGDYRIRQALAYIDNDSERDLSLFALARVAAMSPFHFHRRFREVTGTTVNDYVRRKRLERAAYDLIYTGRRVEEIADVRGYRSAAAFSRSFRMTIGTAPSALRATHSALPAPRVLHRIQPARIVREPSRFLRFIEERGAIVEATGRAWEAFASAALGRQSSEVIGLCPDYPGITDSSQIRYQACAPVSDALALRASAPTRQLPGGWYAQFVHRGRLNDMRHVNELWEDIYHNWPKDSAWDLRTSGAYESFPAANGQAADEPGAVVLHVPLTPKRARSV